MQLCLVGRTKTDNENPIVLTQSIREPGSFSAPRSTRAAALAWAPLWRPLHKLFMPLGLLTVAVCNL